MEIILDENHLYYVDGVNVPGFSQIKNAHGIGESRFYTEDARDAGTAIHSWLNFLARGKMPKEPPDLRIASKIEGIRHFFKDSRFEFAGGEQPLYERVSRYCCTPDLWGYMGGRRCLIEAKSGKKAAWHRLQTAAQSLALWDNGFQVQDRIVLYLKPNGYSLEIHAERRDEYAWRSLVSAYYVKQEYLGGKK